MNKDQEENRSEEARVDSFMQALQRMHNDPAEAARIDAIIEDAENLDEEANSHDRPLVVHIHNEGGHNIVDLSPSPQPQILEEPDPNKAPRETKLRRSHALGWRLPAALPALTLMTTVVITSMGRASSVTWTILASLFMAIAGVSVWLSETIGSKAHSHAVRLTRAVLAEPAAREAENSEMSEVPEAPRTG
ncbi:hypothetical protein [Streptomyces graminilatus]|uniref:hypothetical protein n=1 Tax=Streptomyces graminilatus TaxID=1464070 RepID=UPI000A3DC17E|nr:hypothetical protein [Streptomyces graminilatus]